MALQTDLDRTRETMDATFGELETEHEKTLGDLKQAMAYGPRALLVASHVTACTRLRRLRVRQRSADPGL